MSNLLRCPECRLQGPAPMWWANAKKCPHCQSPLQPYDPDHDLILLAMPPQEGANGQWIRISWSELRVLSIYSRFWAEYKKQEGGEEHSWMVRVVDAITGNLRIAGAGAPLTLADDIEYARRHNPAAKLIRADGTEVQTEPSWLNSPTFTTEDPALPFCSICHGRHGAGAPHQTIGD